MGVCSIWRNRWILKINFYASCFHSGAVHEYGVPSGVRVDGGSEFRHINLMIDIGNGHDWASHIVGQSLHNVRIERLWRDDYKKCSDFHYKLFYYMQKHNILDLQNPVQMFPLQYVFAARIQRTISNWAQAHNMHGIRTENYRTPTQIWFQGSIINGNRDITAVRNIFRPNGNISRQVEQFYEENALEELSDIAILLPHLTASLNNAQMANMSSTVEPLRHSHSDVVDIYVETDKFILDCVTLVK